MNHNLNDPIKSQKEADEVFEYLCNTASETLNIPINVAAVRVAACLELVKRKRINVLSQVGQMWIDDFLKTPQPNENDI